MNIDNQLLSLTMKTSKNTKISEELLPHEFLLRDTESTIPSNSQPNNGTIYTAGYGCSSVTLPSASGFTNSGFRLIIICNNNSNLILNMNSQYSHDVVTFNGNTYSHSETFNLTNRGFVEFVWTLGGWLVLSSYGFNLSD